jgi:hypothetical protein
VKRFLASIKLAKLPSLVRFGTARQAHVDTIFIPDALLFNASDLASMVYNASSSSGRGVVGRQSFTG